VALSAFVPIHAVCASVDVHVPAIVRVEERGKGGNPGGCGKRGNWWDHMHAELSLQRGGGRGGEGSDPLLHIPVPFNRFPLETFFQLLLLRTCSTCVTMGLRDFSMLSFQAPLVVLSEMICSLASEQATFPLCVYVRSRAR
jgi:hypothetical protein